MASRRSPTLVVAALCRRRGRVLLSRRRSDQALPRLWELPGGKVEPGEAPADALRRELFEELGVQARVGRVFDVVFHRYAAFDLVMIVYACRIAGEPRAVAVDDVRWVEPARLAEYKCPPADAALWRRLGRGPARASAKRGGSR
jgi:8-oxo-dGTP diphosphatase